MAEKIAGILGGMGPEATVDLYREIIRLTPSRRDQDHIRVLIYSNPKIPDRTRAIVYGEESPLPLMIESARVLETAGAGVLAIPCNAAHHYLPDLQASVNIPVLNMIGETCRSLKSSLPKVGRAGLLAATGTVRSGIYGKVFESFGVRVIHPDDTQQEKVQSSILQVKAGTHDRTTRDTLQQIGAELVRNGADAVILGCTEIPLAFDAAEVEYPTLNPTRILAEAVVAWAMDDNA